MHYCCKPLQDTFLFSTVCTCGRYTGQDNLVSYTAHIAGGVAGLLLGVVLLRNLSYHTWERAVWWCSLLVFLGLFLGAIVWNAIEIFLNGDIQSFV